MTERPTPYRWSGALRAATGALLAASLLLTSVRLLLTPAFVRAEYAGPGFPDDPYGFTLEERLVYAGLSLEYLLNDSDIGFLADRSFPDGTPLFDPRELSHMVDVKRLVQTALAAWTVCLLGFGLALFVTWRRERWAGVRRSLHLGGRITLALMGALILTLLASFSFLFIGFHRIFFESGTWVFFRSDTLIRLFPERFWRDAFGLVLVLTLVEAAGISVLTRPREN